MPELLSLDPALAARADRLYRELGLDLQTAVHLFLLQSLRENGLPFTLRLTSPSTSAQPDEAVDPAAASESQENIATNLTQHQDTSDELTEEYEVEAEHIAPASSTSEYAASPAEPSAPATDSFTSRSEGSRLAGLRQTFLDMGLIGTALRRIRSLNQIYAMGEANPHVPGWRETYLSGDEPLALDFGSVRIELGFHDGGSLRMMDGRLPDEVLEADAVFPRDLSAVFSPIIGQRLSDVESLHVRRNGHDAEQLRLHFTNGCTLTYAPNEDWGALWLSDPHGTVMFAPDTVWRRTLGERAWQALR